MTGWSYRTVEAREVREGDRIYDHTHYHPFDKWVRVRTVTTDERHTVIDLGYCQVWKHPREGVAVQRQDLLTNATASPTLET